MNNLRKTFDLKEANVLDQLQIDLIHRLTEFSRLVRDKASKDTLVKKAKVLMTRLDEVHGIFEAIVKVE